MKIPKLSLFLIAAFLAFGALTTPRASAQVTVSFFYDTLSPYGEWVQDPAYGYCWHPTNVSEDWQPYTDGYWAYTDSGWTWVSYEDYGGVVYHYGRWAHIPGEGWIWVPGYTWAPAWVSWRSNDAYVGWAPLPPEARWNIGIGFGGWVDARFDIGPGFYSFVGVRDFGAPALGAVIVNRQQNVTIINNTTNITNITVNNSNVYTGGPSYSKISAVSARHIPTLKLVRQGNTSAIRSADGKILSRQQGNNLVVIAPKITGGAAGAPPPKITKTLAGTTADHGWGSVADPQEREKLQAQIKQQAGPDTNSPAKPVNPNDLKLVNENVSSQGTSKTVVAAQSPTPSKKTGKGKTKMTDAELLNAPAAEEPGAAAASATPKTGKSKKSAAPVSNENFSSAEETPIPKAPKGKKHKTPSENESGAYNTEAPAKHSKSSDSNLQPFMGTETSEPKAKKSSDYSAVEARTPRSEIRQKTDKKKKKNEEGYPPGQPGQPGGNIQ